MGFVVFVAGDVHFAEFADQRAVSLGEHGCVVAVPVGCQLRIAEVDADAEFCCRGEKLFGGCASGTGVFGFVEAVEFCFVFKPPAREKGGECQLWIDQQLHSLVVSFVEQGEKTVYDFGTAFAASYRPELGDADCKFARHIASLDGLRTPFC